MNKGPKDIFSEGHLKFMELQPLRTPYSRLEKIAN